MDLSLDSEKNLMKKLFAFFIFVVFINISGLLAQNVIQESGDDTTSPLMMFGFEGDRSSHSDDDDDWQPFLQNERLRDSTDGDYELAERGNSRRVFEGMPGSSVFVFLTGTAALDDDDETLYCIL